MWILFHCHVAVVQPVAGRAIASTTSSAIDAAHCFGAAAVENRLRGPLEYLEDPWLCDTRSQASKRRVRRPPRGIPFYLSPLPDLSYMEPAELEEGLERDARPPFEEYAYLSRRIGRPAGFRPY
jgi:hypothetical protein